MALGFKSIALLPIISVLISVINASVLIFLNKILPSESADSFFLLFGVSLSSTALFNQVVSYNFANFVGEYCSKNSEIRALVVELLLLALVYGAIVWALLFLLGFLTNGINPFQSSLIFIYILFLLNITILYSCYSLLTERYLIVQSVMLLVVGIHACLLYSVSLFLDTLIPDKLLFFFTYSVGSAIAFIFFYWCIFSGKQIDKITFLRPARFAFRGAMVTVTLMIFSVSPFIDALFVDRLNNGIYSSHAMSLRIAVAITSIFASAFGTYYSNSLVLKPDVLIGNRHRLHWLFLLVGFICAFGFLSFSYLGVLDGIMLYLGLNKTALFYNLISVFPMLSLSFLVRDDLNIKRWDRMFFSLIVFTLSYPCLIEFFEFQSLSFSISLAHSISWLLALLAYHSRPNRDM